VSRRGALVATLAALALAGCGSDDDPERGTLAALAPDDATVYTEAVLRPEGEMRDALESSLSLLLDTDDPGGLITDELNQAFAEDDEELSYEGDIEPWLGERGAIFFTELFPDEHAEPAFGDEGERGAIVLEVTDADAAQALIDKAAEEEGSTEAAEYEGVEYTLFDGRVGAGLVGDRTVVADEETLQRVVDTEGGGPSLAGDEEFEDALDGGAETAASLYVDVPSLVEGADAAGQLTRSEEEALDTAFAGLADEPVGATVDVSPNGFGLEVSHGSAELPFLSAAGGSALLRELPDDTWLAAGFKDLGEGFNAFLGRAEDFGVGGVEIDRAEREFMREYGLPLEELYAPSATARCSRAAGASSARAAGSSSRPTIPAKPRGFSRPCAGDRRVPG